MTIPTSTALVTSITLFVIGIAGVLTRRDLLRILISVSIMLASITLLLVTLAASGVGDAGTNYSFALFVWVVEVMEIIIALAIFLHLGRSDKEDVTALTELKW